MKKVLLYSGGMDSWLIDKLWKPDIRLYVNMHTTYSEQEISKLSEDVTIVDFPLGQWERPDAIIPLRNLYLIMVACNITGDEDVEICVGATDGDRSTDQSKEFFMQCEELLGYLYKPQHWIPNGKSIKVITDYKNKTKTQLLEQYIKEGGDVEEAFMRSLSCYHPNHSGEPCWYCKPCFRKFVAFANNGYNFTQDTIDKNMKYITKYIVPELDAGTYRGTEDNEIRSALSIFS